MLASLNISNHLILCYYDYLNFIIRFPGSKYAIDTKKEGPIYLANFLKENYSVCSQF